MDAFVTFSFPVLALVIFARVPFLYAVPAAALVGFMLLPPQYSFDVPGLPAITKSSIIAVSLLVLSLAFAPRQERSGRVLPPSSVPDPEVLPGLIPRIWWVRVCLAGLVIGPVFTVLTNPEPVFVSRMRPGLGLRDVINEVSDAFFLILPILVFRKYLGGEAGQRTVLLSVAAAGLVYSLPTVFEIRMSPQLHNIVYGYFPHSFAQHIRGDGFRPLVFMTHALVLALFLGMSLLALLAHMRTVDSRDSRALYALAAVYMAIVLVLSKSLGPILIVLIFLPLFLFAGPRTQTLAAAAIAVFVLSYPAARSAGINPFQPVLAVVEPIAPGRAGSLDFRLDEESVIVARAMEKPLFGWGGFGRSIPAQSETGRTGVRDGLWLIVFGEQGWVGFVGFFGLFAGPLIALAAGASRYRPTLATSGLALLLGANLLDLIPNSGLTIVTAMIAGALIGGLEHAKAGSRASAESAPESRPRRRLATGRRAGSGPVAARTPQTTPHDRTSPATRTHGPASPKRPEAPPEPAPALGPGSRYSRGAGRYTRFPTGEGAPRRS